MMPILLKDALPYDPNQVTPGVIGFVATLIVACAVMLLMWDLNRRVRRINDRAEIQERLRAERAAAEAEAASAESAGAEVAGADAAGADAAEAPSAERP